MLSGENGNGTSPRTELLVSQFCLVTPKWKVMTGSIAAASWPGERYPNMSTQIERNWIDDRSDKNGTKYVHKCGPQKSYASGCLYDVDAVSSRAPLNQRSRQLHLARSLARGR